MTTTILPNEMRGVMHITGARGIGKTYLASQADFPDNIIFLDFENKGESVNQQLNFGSYQALTQMVDADPLRLYNETIRAIDTIEKNRFTVCIMDNISWLELALRAEASHNVDKYIKAYNLNKKNVMAGRFGGFSSVVNFLVSDTICNRLHAKGVQLIIATSHIKASWGPSGIIPNKFRVKGADRWQELSILSLILVPGEHAPTPSALVRKEQLGTISISDSNTMSSELLEAIRLGDAGHSIKRRLPLRLPMATFQSIRYYLANPADLNNPQDGESPSADESFPFSAKLDAEQIAFMRESMRYEERKEQESKEALEFVEEVEQAECINGLVDAIREISPDGTMIAPEVNQALQEKGISAVIPDIVGALMKINTGG